MSGWCYCYIISEATVDSKIEEDDLDSQRRICLICGGTEKEPSLFVLRAPEHLNGKVQHDLAVTYSSLLISKDQEGRKLGTRALSVFNCLAVLF